MTNNNVLIMKKLILMIVVLALCSCQEHPKKRANLGISPLKWNLPTQQHIEEREEIIPLDSQFVHQGISSTEIVDKRVWGLNYLFVDSTKDKAYLKLDNKLKLKLLPKILNMDTTWIKDDISAYLISRQEKIGKLHPIIILTSGTDFGALLMIILDEEGDEISGMFLSGGENSGPLEDLDSVLLLRPYKRSFFNSNQINSYSLSARVKTYKTNKPDIIDSVTYRTTIKLDGTIFTEKIDSVRIKRKYIW
jgi:hypothetical protein